jgi:hypothetical protein
MAVKGTGGDACRKRVILSLLPKEMMSSIIFTGLCPSTLAPTFFPHPSGPDTGGTLHKRKRYEVLTAVLTKLHIYCRVDWLMVADASEDVSASVFRVLLHPHHSNVGITDLSILHAATDCLKLHEYPRLPSYVWQCRKDTPHHRTNHNDVF